MGKNQNDLFNKRENEMVLLTEWARGKLREIISGGARSDKPLELVEREMESLKRDGTLSPEKERNVMGYYGDLSGWFARASHEDRVLRLAYFIYLEECRWMGQVPISSEGRFAGNRKDSMFAAQVEPYATIAERVILDLEREQKAP